MKIHIKLYATLALDTPKIGPETDFIEIQEGLSIGEILDWLGLSRESPKIIFVNGVHANMDTIPKEGDRVAVFPPIAGG